MTSYLSRLGIVPVINCGSMRSFYGNTAALPEVIEAMADAAGQHIIMDELQRAVSKRLAELTGFEAGLVTAGSAAALFLSAAACIAGNDPEKMLRLPRNDPSKKYALMPATHRFSYDHAFRLAGLEIVEANTVEQAYKFLEQGTTAFIFFLGLRGNRGPLSFADVAHLGQKHAVPIIVDAASELLHRPNPWLNLGADLVIYSSGKYMRGPQASGLLLGRRALIEAAWRNASPQQASARGMKVGKDQMIGAVVAVERWFAQKSRRTEVARCIEYLAMIKNALAAEPSLKTEFFETPDWSLPRLRVSWETRPGTPHANELRHALLGGTPRVLICDLGMTPNSVLIDAFSLEHHQCSIVAEKIAAFFQSEVHTRQPEIPSRGLDNLVGTWQVAIDFSGGEERHRFVIEEQGDQYAALHVGRTFQAQMEVKIYADRIELASKVPYDGVHLYYEFIGQPDGNGGFEGRVVMGAGAANNSGPVGAAQFGTVHWRATRPQASG